MLTVELGWSNCSKSQFTAEPEFCPLDSSKPTFTCDFHVVEKAWENSKEVVHGKCPKYEDSGDAGNAAPALDNDFEANLEDLMMSEESDDQQNRRRKREVKYGESHSSEDDKETLMEIAKFAVEQLDQVDEDSRARFVVDILKAKKQVTFSAELSLIIDLLYVHLTRGYRQFLGGCTILRSALLRAPAKRIQEPHWRSVKIR